MTLNLISISIQYIMNCSTAKGSISNAKEQCISPALEEGGGVYSQLGSGGVALSENRMY